MRWLTILRILGVLLMLFSFSMLPPVGVAEYYGDGAGPAFLIAYAFTLFTGALCWIPTRHAQQELKIRDGFLVVVLFWLVLSLFGSLPFWIPEHPHASFIDSFFEATSGLTATGVNVFSGLDHLPHAIRYYRQQLQFLGGMGIVVLAVAVLPMLGIGGMQLYRAETPGPVKDNKITPRIAETAKQLWYIYVGLTTLCALCYGLAGMSWFDAIGESFSTVATGGFSTHDASFAFYQSQTIELIAVIFMLLGGANFGLHYLAIKHRSLLGYWKDLEFRAYIYISAVASIAVCLGLVWFHVYPHTSTAIVKSVFTVVSLATTTGFTSGAFDIWPTYIPFLIMFVAMIGGCAASTAGGIKVIRAVILKKEGARELQRLVHPRAVIPLKYGDSILPERVVQAVWGYISVFIAIFTALFLFLMASGMDMKTAFGALVACVSNAGAGIGNIDVSLEAITPFAKWVLVVAMLAGRLEIFSLLVLFTPTFWRN